MFPTRLVQKPSSVPTLLPVGPSFGYQDNLPVVYLLREQVSHSSASSTTLQEVTSASPTTLQEVTSASLQILV
jgi:hypothetical protein